MRIPLAALALAVLAACHAVRAPSPTPAASPAAASAVTAPVSEATGVPGVSAAQLRADYWIRALREPDRVILSADAIARQNRALLERDSSVYDIERLPATLTQVQVRGWVERLSRAPGRRLYDVHGDSVSDAQVRTWIAAANAEAVPASQPARFGLIVRRADLRTFPTTTRVFSGRGNTDIDRFQETAFFPGTPVAIVHESRDRGWWFVIGRTYAAWVEKAYVAEGTREQVLGYAARTPFVVVTGARERTVFTPERPAVSDLPLDMSTRLPLLADWPAGRPVNGENPYSGHVVQLPVRTATGGLELVPAILPRTADVSVGYPPLTAANLLRQAFKFLGERYGWGHSYDARDCSGFASDVYRSLGVDLPRNTGDQAASPVLNRLPLTDADGHEKRLAVLREAEPGDLIFIPGHNMVVIGHVGDQTYIIHDTPGMNVRGADGSVTRVPLNGVSVTTLTDLLDGDRLRVDNIRVIQRVRP